MEICQHQRVTAHISLHVYHLGGISGVEENSLLFEDPAFYLQFRNPTHGIIIMCRVPF